jgi:hypothetical protein
MYFHNNPPISGKWDYTSLMFRLKPGDTGIQIAIEGRHVGRRLLIDAVQLRRLTPPADAAPLEVSEISEGYGAELIDDPQAEGGKAWKVAEGLQPRGGKIAGPIRRTEAPGLYKATYRFKQIRPADKARILIKLNGSNGQTLEEVYPEDFNENGAFQDFEAWFFYAFGEGSHYGWDWSGQGEYVFDFLKLELLQTISFREAWAVLAEGVDATKTFSDPARRKQSADVWVAVGPYTDLYNIKTVLESCELTRTDSYLDTIRGGGLQLVPPMPKLDGMKIVVLSDVPSRVLSPIEQLALRNFVESGGTLVVFGGLYGYGHGGMQGSFIEEIMPVEITRTFDLVRIDPPKEMIVQEGQKLGQCEWIHEVKVKSAGTVAAEAGGRPAVVTGAFGKGKVIAIPATVLGEPKEPFWTTSQWQQELKKLFQ